MNIETSERRIEPAATHSEQKNVVVRSSQVTRHLLDMCMHEGFDAHELLDGSRLTREQLNDPATLVYRHQEFIVLGNLVSRSEDPALAFRLGSRLRISTLGVLGYALITSETLRDAVHTALKYAPLTTTWGAVELEESGREGILVLDSRGIPEPVRSFAADWDLASLFRMLRDVVQRPGAVQKIWIDHPPLAPERMYVEATGCMPSFNKPASIITFDRTLLDSRLPLHNCVAHRQALAACEAEVGRYRAMTNTSGRIRDLLLQNASAMPTLEDVSRQLLMTPRTLRRRLATEDTSFRDLVEAVRLEQAKQKLCTSRLSVQEISASLGYRDTATFSTAFKRWTGMTPGAFRRDASLRGCTQQE